MNNGLEAVFRAMLGGLMLVATALVLVSVVMRYFFDYALSWSDELTQYSLLWLIFLGSGVAARRGGHISMEVLLTVLSPRARQLDAVLVNAVCAALSGVVAYLGWRLAMTVRDLGQIGPASGLPVFWVYLAIPVGCFLMTLGFWEVALRRLKEPEPPPDTGEVSPEKLSLPG